ncbi:TPA: autotransporter domain-containing protein [Escherichia coli]|nr:autotransporter domain-containing protein [Escherichia coli]HCO5222678.1 autotransporter domain-containing protein [Escherichia coli]HCO5231377.1 autotransporter domain-containing protein [Escherichia coli]HCO7139447.1 autotransporter domain-containing protein [Escherichia coli]HCO7192081.1 autotransporter domain-containing protein [Escherichia coli]
MSGKRYPEEFKIEAVKQVVDRGYSVTAAAGSNMTFSPSRNGTSLDLQAGLEARVRENITLGVQAGYAHSVSGSSAEGYNGQATLNVTF